LGFTNMVEAHCCDIINCSRESDGSLEVALLRLRNVDTLRHEAVAEWEGKSDDERAQFFRLHALGEEETEMREQEPPSRPPSSSSASSAVTNAAELAAAETVGVAAAPAAATAGPFVGDYPPSMHAIIKHFDVMTEQLVLWADSVFPGRDETLVEAAEEGYPKAQAALGMKCLHDPSKTPSQREADSNRWFGRAVRRNSSEALFRKGVLVVLATDVKSVSVVNAATAGAVLELVEAVQCIKSAAVLGLVYAQYAMGALHLTGFDVAICTGVKQDVSKAVSWFRKAATQGLREAQWEMGEIFRQGLIHNVSPGLARRYIKLAKIQGHAGAVARMKQFRSCLFCGAETAPKACSLCLHARYCDATCFEEHWSRGGGGGVCLGDDAPHKDTCPRTHDDPCK
jgi:TPR repeat protein